MDVPKRRPLTRTQERRVVREMTAGREADEMLEGPQADSLSDAERRRLTRISDRGRRARWTLVETNIGIAHKILRKVSSYDVPDDDLFQAAVEGLLDATERFDPSKGFRFSTYAESRIYSSVVKARAVHRGVVYVPQTKITAASRYADVYDTLAIELERKPSDAEMADRMGISVDAVVRTRILNDRTMMDLSLDATIPTAEGDGTTSYASMLVDPSIDIEAGVDEKMRDEVGERVKEAIRTALDDLPARQREGVLYRFGIGDHEQKTPVETADALGVSYNTVRADWARASRRLERRLLALISESDLELVLGD